MRLAQDVREPRLPWLALSLLALPPALIAVLQLGRVHCDEVFQTLEPAHQFAFGNTVLPWEWEDGLRNWALPGALGLLLKLCGALGIDDPQARRAVLEVPQYALHLASLAALFLLVRRCLEARGDAKSVASLRIDTLHSVALVALYAPVLQFAGRTMGEAWSTSLMLIAFERLEPKGRSFARYVLAGILLGTAIVVRYGSGVIAIAAGLYLLKERRIRDACALALGGAIPIAGLGVLDWVTWGAPYHSLRAYAGYNVLSNEAAERFGAEPFWYYLPWLVVAVSLWAWVVLVARFLRGARPALRATRPIGVLVFCALFYVAVISVVEHKEVRFLYPAMVFLMAAAAPAWIAFLRTLAERWRIRGLLGSLAIGLVLLIPRTDFTPRRSNQFRMFVRAAREGTGIILLHTGVWGSPGHFFSGTRPWMMCDDEEDDPDCLRLAIIDPQYNRVVGWLDEGARTLTRAGFRRVEKNGSVVLWSRAATGWYALPLAKRVESKR